MGSEPRLFDKVWIHEISPSRTEVRVLPVVEDGTSIPNSDLQSRYDTFVNCGTFAADVLVFIDDFINQFDVAKVVKNMLMKKGTISEGQNYIKLIEQEFKLVNFEVYLTQTKKLFQQIVDNYRMNRYYNPFESNFGKPTGESFGVEFDIARTFDEICEMASNAAEFSLPRQDIRLNTAKTLAQTKTLDKVKQIVRTVTSNEEFQSTRPEAKAAQIRGCMDSKAKNYNPQATIPSQCVYDVTVTNYRDIKVCNDKGAKNYGKDGECDYSGRCNDASATNYGSYAACTYPSPPKPVVQKTSSGSSGSSGSSSGGSSLCKYGSRYSISGPPDKSFTKSGGDGVKGVKVLIDCGAVFNVCTSRVGFQLSGVPSWITPNMMSNDTHSAGNFKYTVAANSGPARSATITITPNGAAVGGRSYSFTVTQAAGSTVKVSPPRPQPPVTITPSSPSLTTSPNIIGFSASGVRIDGSAYITIETTDSWTATYSGDVPINLSKSAGSGRGRVDVQCTGANPIARPLQGQVIIRTSGGITRSTSIYQQEGSGNSYGTSGTGLSRRGNIQL